MPRRGAHTSSGSTRPPRPPPSREVTVSKAMSYILRHAAAKEGVKLDSNGYANVADLLAWPKLKSLRVTFAELQQIVAENDKQRFALVRVPSPPSTSSASSPPNPSDYLIRASQGHSLPIASANLLTPLLPTSASFPVEVVHGTSAASWAQILSSGGLKRMRRTHVHFATGEPPRKTPQPHNPADSNTGLDNEEEEAAAAAADGEGGTGDGEKAVVVSGMRATASVLVWVDVRRAMDEGGIAWWRSGNGVVLTEGDGAGMVGLRFVRRVVRRGTGEVIWMPEGGRGREGRSGLDGIGDRNSWQARLAVGLGTRNVGRRKRGWGEGQTEVENR